jgi:hypothetical protein
VHLGSDIGGDLPGYGRTAADPEPAGVYKVVVSGLKSGEATATFEVLGEEFVLELALIACSHD